MLVNAKIVLDEAKKGKFGVPAPDYLDLDSARVFVQVAQEVGKPVILSYPQVLDGALPLAEAATIGKLLAAQATVPVVLHLDHGEDVDFVKRAIDLGFSSVMIDASEASFEENVRRTCEVVDYAHQRGVTVEAEIGHVGHGESLAEVGKTETIYTTAKEAIHFVELTGVDSLAVSIGTVHGIYKGLEKPLLNFERLIELNEALSIPLVLHGGSGTGDENLHRCVTSGISKVNIFTDFLAAAYNQIQATSPKNYLAMKKTANDAMAQILRHHYEVFSND